MADITRRRSGEFLRCVLKQLWDKPEGLQAKDILEAIPKSITLTEFEKGFYPSTPNSPRYQKIIRFGTIGLVHAGWMVKSKGRWFITEEGRQAFNKFKDPEEFCRESDRLYKVWYRNRPEKVRLVSDALAVQKVSFTVEEAEEKAWEQINQFLQDMKPYEFQEVVADLLRAMDYHVSWVSPPGKDRGVDIIAYTDPLGASVPRIKVQVKHRDQAVATDGLRSFLATLGADDIGIFVSSGGFTSDARDEARTQERRKVTLLDLENLFDLWVEHYDKLSQEARQRFPLKPIHFLATVD
jgi:restriction system protein